MYCILVMNVPLSTFQIAYKGKSISDVPQSIIAKAQQFKETFSCFKTYYDPKMIWEKKRFTKKDRQVAKPKNRFHIILHDFTDTSINKRQLMGLLNKLTENNKSTIYIKIQTILEKNNNEEFFLLVWSYIKTNDNDLYMNILHLFDNAFLKESIDKLWEAYIQDKGWLPPDYVFENNLLLLNDDYEMYCDYVKWKQEIHNLNSIWVKLGKDINCLLHNIYEYFTMYIEKRTEHTHVYRYIIDVFLEQMQRLLKHVANTEIINKIRQLNIQDFESSSKFLIYDILEKNK